MTDLVIPEEFKDQLVFRENPDKRTDAEILDSISKFQPVTSEKNVWSFWDKGVEKMPSWCQRNVINWIRILGPTWTVRVLDQVPESPNHALKYVREDSLPEAWLKRTMDGPYKGPHACDLLRGACLYEHGGVFMDVGNILIRNLDRVCWSQLEDPNSPFQVATPWMYGCVTGNHFVAARKGDPFIKRWHELFVYLWKERTNYEGLIQSPLLAFAHSYGFEQAKERNFDWDFKVSAQTVFEYITQVVCWMRLCMLEDAGDGFSGVDYWTNNVLIWDVLPESWGGEETVGFKGSGQKMYDLLSVRRDADPNSEEYKEAYRLVWRLLTKSTMQKITHGKGLTDSVHLGVLWDENEGKDCEPGTFAELLRFGAVHFEQTRPEITYVKAPRPDPTFQKGVFEP